MIELMPEAPAAVPASPARSAEAEARPCEWHVLQARSHMPIGAGQQEEAPRGQGASGVVSESWFPQR